MTYKIFALISSMANKPRLHVHDPLLYLNLTFYTHQSSVGLGCKGMVEIIHLVGPYAIYPTKTCKVGYHNLIIICITLTYSTSKTAQLPFQFFLVLTTLPTTFLFLHTLIQSFFELSFIT